MNKEEQIKLIITSICNYYNLEIDVFNSKSRISEIIKARHLALYMLRYNIGLSFREIGQILNKDCSTITRNFISISNMMKYDIILKKEYTSISSVINKYS